MASFKDLTTYTVPESDQAADENRFTYHPPRADQASRYEFIRSIAGRHAAMLRQLCPPSRELSVAITKLDEVVFWANAAIARNE